MVSEILPFVESKFEAEYSAAIKINAKRQQAVTSLPKIALYIEKYGWEKSRELINQKEVLSKIIPYPAQILSYFYSFIFMTPGALAMPFERVGSAIIFVPNKPFLFNMQAVGGMYEALISVVSPVATDPKKAIFAQEKWSSLKVRRYISFVVECINNVLNYFNNFSNFLDDEGYLDSKKYIQANSALFHIFNELLALNTSSSTYIRTKLCLSIINKLANLIKTMCCSGRTESEISRYLLSNDSKNKVNKIVYSALKTRDIGLAKHLSRMVTDCYEDVYSEARDSLVDSVNNDDIVDYIWSLRNMTEHGVFLNRSQFENRIMKSKGEMPASLVALSYFLILALVVNPKRMLEY